MGENSAFDFKASTISVNTTPTQLSATSERFTAAVFTNLDDTNIIYVGKSNVLSGGADGFGIAPATAVSYDVNGNLSEIYVVAAGGTNLKFSYVIFK